MILVLRALGVGDLATAVPALRGLRAAYPDRELALLAPAWLGPLVDLVGGVDRLVPLDGLDADVGWSGPPPTVAVNLHGRGPRSHRLLADVGAARLVAFSCPQAGHTDGPEWDGTEHEVRRWCRLLHWYGVPADPCDLALRRPVGAGVPDGTTVVHPGTKVEAKRWPAQRFAAVAAALGARGHRVVVTGSAAERDLAGWVTDRAGLPPGAVLAGRTDLAELAALVARARLVVSGDTGVAHLATGYGTPSVVLFGPESPQVWGPPPGRPWHRVVRGAGQDCPTADGESTDLRLVSVQVEEVLAAVDEVERTVRRAGAVAA
ncbi:glycosyltransferase family 9 protein [Micromonospora sp. SH-82]|uniref:glycosyltransferase family 9 protein n=1 Tax=Micromonospora sp. SH-82 TaxID=3132938 RepID=UPI003EC06387